MSMMLRHYMQSGTAAPATINSLLFAASEPGVWYDNTDLTTMYQGMGDGHPTSSQITTPGQAVGFQLDKSRWGGLTLAQHVAAQPELWTGTPTALGTGWVNNGDGSFTITSAASQSDFTFMPAGQFIGRGYRYSFTISGVTGTPTVYALHTNPFNVTNGTYSGVVQNPGITMIFRAATGQSLTVSNISIKEVAGRHRVQATTSKRPTYGRMPKRGVVNKLVRTDDFSNAIWNKTSVSATADTITATSTFSAVHQATIAVAAGSTTYSVELKAGTSSWASLRAFGFDANAHVWFNLSAGTVGTQTGATGTITASTDGYFICSITFTTTTDLIGDFYIYLSDGDNSFSVTNGRTIQARKAQVEAGSSRSGYQASTTIYDVTEAGQQTCHYLAYDGVDDALATAAVVNLSATDEITLLTGVRRMTDTLQVAVEHSANFNSNAGTFVLFPGANSGGGNAASYYFGGGGTSRTPAAAASGLAAAPAFSVVTGTLDISADSTTIRHNGVAGSPSAVDAGTGNFTSQTLHFGARGGTSLFWNGYDFGTVVRGALTSGATLTSAESLMSANVPGVLLTPILSLAELFAASEPGVWYDNTDLATMAVYNGALIASPGDTPGLQLDKSQGLALGPELVVNGGFDDATGWTSSGVTISGGIATVTAATFSIQRPITLSAGSIYKVTLTKGGTATGNLWVRFIGGTASNSVNIVPSPGTVEIYMLANTSNTSILIERATGDSTGLTLDNISVKRIAGNHRIQATASKRPTYGRMPKRGRVNILTQTGFASGWTGSGLTTTTGQADSQGGTVAAAFAASASGAASRNIYQIGKTLAAGPATWSVDLKAGEVSWVVLSFYDGTARPAWFNLATGTIGNVSTGGAASITSLGGGWYRCSVTYTTAGGANCGLLLEPTTANAVQGATLTAGDKFYAGRPQVEQGGSATGYQAVTTIYDVTEAGQQTCHYLQYDGVDDAMQSAAALNLSGTDALTAISGLYKTSDAAIGVFYEHSADVNSTTGTFMFAPNYDSASGLASAKLNIQTKGTARSAINTNSGYASPVFLVAAQLSDISDDSQTLRVNGAVPAQTVQGGAADLGTGNFGNHVLYFGGRNTSSLYFSGRDFGTVVRGALTVGSTLTSAETLMSANTPTVTL